MTTDISLLIFRALLGAFFILYRFRWVYDPSLPDQPASVFKSSIGMWVRTSTSKWFNAVRHAKLEAKLMECGYWPQLAAPVALVELAAGGALIIGLFTRLAAAGLFIILIAATFKTWRQKVGIQKPVDKIDCVSCYLWLCEPLYIAMCFALVLQGAGSWSLDALVLP